MQPSRYESRGVSADKNEVHAAIKKLDHGLFKNTFCKILPQPFTTDDQKCMILHADTAGTKPILAYLYWKETGDVNVWKGIAQDALVMNLDDMACCGLTDQFIISNTILRNKHCIPGVVLETIIQGTIDFIENMKTFGVSIHHAGGETADVGDVVRTADIGYTAYTEGYKNQIFENNIQSGDLILGLGSYGQTSYETNYNSGIGCNGLTSARHDVLSGYYTSLYPETFDPVIDSSLVYNGSYRMTDSYQGQTVGKLLLSPTRTFLPFLKNLFQQDRLGLHGIIHNTGGGHSKVLKFVNNVEIIKDNLPQMPPIFDIIQSASGNTPEELYKVFNMGIRLEIYGDARCIDNAAKMASTLDIPNQIIGRVEEAKNGKSRILMKVKDKIWSYS